MILPLFSCIAKSPFATTFRKTCEKASFITAAVIMIIAMMLLCGVSAPVQETINIITGSGEETARRIRVNSGVTDDITVKYGGSARNTPSL